MAPQRLHLGVEVSEMDSKLRVTEIKIEPSDWRKSQRSRKPVSAANDGLSGPVKKSRSGICHAPGSTYYARTLNFKPFTTIDSCLTSGGRLPKR